LKENAPKQSASAVPHSAVISDHHLQELFKGVVSPEAAASLDLGKFPFIDPGDPPLNPQDQALWPLYGFMMAEVYGLRGDAGQAKKWYQGLTTWAAADPYKDGWGASGLVSVALWRWCQMAAKNPELSPQEGEQILKATAGLRKTRFMKGMYEPSHYLMALPQLQEETLRSLVLVAFRQNKTREALGYFIEYLTVARNGELNEVELALLKKATDEQRLSMGKVALIIGKRLESLKDYEGAKGWLSQAEQTGSLQVQAEASFYLARLGRPRGKCPDEKTLKLLDKTIQYATDPDLVQDALYLRASLYMREGWCRNETEFIKSLDKLLKDFPEGQRADDALYKLALYNLDLFWTTKDDTYLDRALDFFQKIRKVKGQNDYLDSSWFQPAMTFYARGKPEDRQQATKLLQDLIKKRPSGPLRVAASFWLGRMAAESGDTAQSEKYFRQVIQDFPFDYYAIRARMHLHLLNKAATEIQPDQATRKELQDAYDAARKQLAASPPVISGESRYHVRLKHALESRLSYRTLSTFIDIKRQSKRLRGKRCENIPLAELDKHFLLAPTVILMSLRQDALAAAASPPEPDNLLEIAGAIRYLPKDDKKPYADWPLVILLIEAQDHPYQVRSKIQRDVRYPAIAYPDEIFARYIKQYSQEFQVAPELLYSIMRDESNFYPLAISPDGALGLVPFSTMTFNALDRRWKLMQIRQIDRSEGPEGFLLDPDANIYLGARFFGKELLPRQKEDMVLALLEFYSGYQAVKKWRVKWQQTGKEGDYEFMLETAPHRGTAYFARHVLGTFSIVQSAGIYGKD
jgi:soluble lytic murein transglycosylase